ncbi:MAG: IS21 family transposase [Rubripirellula sp.]|nr:IS21 family transposase [Rubripirellula sp.]
MANHLQVAKVLSIKTLHDQGWSQRRIARELGISRDAVARHLREHSNQAKAPTGSSDQLGTAKPAKAPTGSRSCCGPFHELIVAKLEQGLTAQRIFQDLVDDHGFDQKYHSVRRYVAKLNRVDPLPFRRFEVAAGEEAQIDFGTGAPVITKDGRRRKTHVLRVVLSQSRKAYSEVVFRQTTDNLIGVLENAFMHFGGVPKTLVPDNLKAAVIKADWYDPDLNPKLQSFCEHYGTVLLPTKPRTPRHKGKVERGVAYVQDNALKGHTFDSLEAQNDHLTKWESNVADTRLHGTTKRQVKKMFEEQERDALGPLPVERFPCFQEARRIVSRDGHIAVNKAYYSVPPEYVGHEVWVRFDLHLVRVFTGAMKPICTHATAAQGKFSTLREHIASEKISIVERGADWLLQKVSLIGPQTRLWAEGLVAHRGVQSVRVMQGLLGLSRKHSSDAIEQACATAHSYGEYRLASIRKLIDRAAPTQEAFEFLEDHPIIRNLSDYGNVVRIDFGKEANL